MSQTPESRPEPTRPVVDAQTPTWAPGSHQADGADSSDFLGMELTPSIEEASRSASNRAAPSELTADFGKYVLLGEIGRGGMGVVYKAHQKGLNRIVAVKMILGSHLAGAEQINRFYAEARAAALLHDPHVVAIHDVGEIFGQHYFAMEFVDGPSLGQRLENGPLDVQEAAKLVSIVARAVGRLHERGIVHRDLKPSNILLDSSGRPFVTDFGLAKMFDDERSQTKTNAIVGTPAYMAPEQASGRGAEVGPHSDIYSLGAILYELLTGRPPFVEANPLDTLVRVLEAEPTPPSRLRSNIPQTLESICLKCLEKSPNARYSSAAALADDLDRFASGEFVEASRFGVWQWLRRWARREPSLVSRLSTMAICASALQFDQFVRQDFDPMPNRRIMVVLGLGAAVSLTFQTLLNRDRWSVTARYAWATADITLFTTLVAMTNALTTPLVAGFFILVSASGLWFRERLVWYTTALSVLAYLILVLIVAVQAKSVPDLPHLHVLFMLLLAVSGLIIGYQVRRVRILSQR